MLRALLPALAALSVSVSLVRVRTLWPVLEPVLEPAVSLARVQAWNTARPLRWHGAPRVTTLAQAARWLP
ncbi:hypothetical protein GCM10028797_21890 [Dyella agri]